MAVKGPAQVLGVQATPLGQGFGQPDGHGRVVGIAQDGGGGKGGPEPALFREAKGQLPDGIPQGAAEHAPQVFTPQLGFGCQY